MSEKIILLPNSEQQRVTVDPHSLTEHILKAKPEEALLSDRNAKMAKFLFVLGFTLLMISALFATLFDNSSLAPLLSAVGLICHTISKKLEHRDLAVKKKLAILENQNLTLALHGDRLTEGEIRNPDLELIRNRNKYNFTIHLITQIVGLIVLTSSAITPFLDSLSPSIHINKFTPTLMQLGFILFTAGAQLEEFQDRHEKRTYRKASLDLKMEMAKRHGNPLK